MLAVVVLISLALQPTKIPSPKRTAKKKTPEQIIEDARATLGDSNQWTLVASGETVTQFIKTSDLITAAERKQSYRSAWVLSVYVPGEKLGSTMAFREFACLSTDRKYRDKTYTAYRNRDRTDVVPGDNDAETAWRFIVPDTIGEAQFDAVCSDDVTRWRPVPTIPAAGPRTIASYKDGTMDAETRAAFEEMVKTGLLGVPMGFELDPERPPRYLDCEVQWKSIERELLKQEDLDKQRFHVVVLDNGENATVSRCSASALSGEYACDSYDAEKVAYDDYARIYKYYFFASQFDVQLFPDGRLLENSGRGRVAWASCTEQFSDLVKKAQPRQPITR